MPQQQQQAGMQDHMQALTELRQYVRAEQNRPVLGASRQNTQQAGGPGMGNLGSLLASIMGGQGGGAGGGGVGQGMMAQGMMPQGTGGLAGGRIPPPSVSPYGAEQGGEREIPGSVRRRRGGLVPMPGMQNYSSLMGRAGY